MTRAILAAMLLSACSARSLLPVTTDACSPDVVPSDLGMAPDLARRPPDAMVPLDASVPPIVDLAPPVDLLEVDATRIHRDWGWPVYFGSAGSFAATVALALPVTVGNDGMLDGLGVIPASAGAGRAHMALYRDDGGQPGALVIQGSAFALDNDGPVLLDLTDIPIVAGDYWVAIRFEQTTAVGASAVPTRRCHRSFAYFPGNWPDPFGAATCATATTMNLFIRTY